ncbi:sulfate transporter [Chthoniobacter flavus Ellin428]|uniref:Sulfate transporter n=1 Tax=Chthoniobacter flavus Ellin428 TaxID=497964 RepID=B4D8K1_9BACT|nr:SulP family inorganic anion transporter [Chthoniobacter flavus]EDY17223.1 sulfate transporter [Chthoniobacter flavus Ellin428]TCO86951.1 high affinity sulfate transporter 1 [Chthoniobacter flavus]
MSAPSTRDGPPGGFGYGRLRLPALEWLRSYQRSWFRTDLAAGVTLAAYMLPAALGDASLAHLPPQAGLYACLFGGLVFWLFCSSRHTAVSVTSAISLLVGSSLGGMAGEDVARFSAMAAATALLAAAIAFVAWLVRAGSVVNFISETVMTGFKLGVAMVLASTQLPKLFGVPGGHGDVWECFGVFFRHIHETNEASLLLGGGALAVLILGKKLLPHKPVALFVVVGGIALATFIDLGVHGVKLLGEVPRGLPVPSLPAVDRHEISELLPLALACFLLGAVETAAIGRMFAAKHGYRFDSNQEFLAIAASNLASGLMHGFPVSGGTSQSLVNESSGARTSLSGLISAVLIAIVAVFFTELLRNLPQPVLAAVVLMAVASLVKVEELRRLWRVHRAEFLVAMTAFLGVLWEGLLKGVLVGAVISLVLLIRRVSTPHVAFLGRIPGAQRYSDLERHADNEPTPGILAFRVEAGIVYFNTDHIFDSVLKRLNAATEPIHLVICDLSTSPRIDMAGAHLFLTLHAELAKRGIALRVVEAHSNVRDMLRVEGLEEKIGRIDRFTSLAHAIDDDRKTPA